MARPKMLGRATGHAPTVQAESARVYCVASPSRAGMGRLHCCAPILEKPTNKSKNENLQKALKTVNSPRKTSKPPNNQTTKLSNTKKSKKTKNFGKPPKTFGGDVECLHAPDTTLVHACRCKEVFTHGAILAALNPHLPVDLKILLARGNVNQQCA